MLEIYQKEHTYDGRTPERQIQTFYIQPIFCFFVFLKILQFMR